MPVEGYFRRAKQSAKWFFIFTITVVLGGAAIIVGVTVRQMPIVFGTVVIVILVTILSWRKQQHQLVKVSLHDGQLLIMGAGYHIQMQAPFRYQTGIQRVRATWRTPEYYFLRMVLDVYGKPLVFEEQVPSTVKPPQLDEIHSVSSALGVPELCSLTRYPGTLWAIIQQFDAMSSQSHREQVQRDIENLYRIGGQQLNSNSYYAAIQTFSEIIRLTPNSPYPYYNRGMAHFYHGRDLDKALRDLTTALRLKPKFEKAYRFRGLVHAENGDWASLRDDMTEAIRLNPENSELHNMRGAASYRLQDYQSALADFNRAIELSRTNPEPFHNRGLVKQREGDLDGAIRDFQYALELKPSFEPARESLQIASEQKKQAGS